MQSPVASTTSSAIDLGEAEIFVKERLPQVDFVYVDTGKECGQE